MNILLLLWDFIVTHWSDILVVVVFVAAMIALWKKGNKALVRKIIKKLVIQAEKQLGSKTGPLKKDLVYDMLPWLLKIILTREDVSQLIDDAAAWLNKYLDDHPTATLLSYGDENQKNAATKEIST